MWSVCSPALQLQLSLVKAPCPPGPTDPHRLRVRASTCTPLWAGSDTTFVMYLKCTASAELVREDCAMASQKTTKKMRTHLGAHLKGSGQSTNAKNFCGLLTSYSSQLPRWESRSNENNIFPSNVCLGWQHERLLKTHINKNPQGESKQGKGCPRTSQKHLTSLMVWQSHSNVSI